METISHARKAAYQDNVVMSLKENHALPIATEGGHAKLKQSILLLEASQATAHMEKGGHACKGEAGHITSGDSTNGEYYSCKKGYSPRRCGCVIR